MSASEYKSTPITAPSAMGFILVNSLEVFVGNADSSSVSDNDDVEELDPGPNSVGSAAFLHSTEGKVPFRGEVVIIVKGKVTPFS